MKPRLGIAIFLMASAISWVEARAQTAPRQMEYLGRGVAAIHQESDKVWVSWRLLATDPESITFNLYRTTGNASPVKVNAEPIAKATSFRDQNVNLTEPTSYSVRPVVDGKEQEASKAFKFPANAPVQNYISIPLKTPPGYTPNDTTVADLDGDGEYEIILHQTGRAQDNSIAGVTDEPILQAYKLDGTLIWTINLGHNIRDGAHYTQFMVYDLDGDGRAELVCKTADGSTDGQGKVIGDAKANYVNLQGFILDGPEFLTVFDGPTGKALYTTDYVPVRATGGWGGPPGNILDRYLACVAYLDGVHPSVVMCRGYYTRSTLVAWDWKDGKLVQRWFFDSDKIAAAGRGNPYRGQGNHQLTVGDVDGDGKDEIVYGAMCIDDDGKPIYSTRLGHGDALHLSDMDPDRPGLEIFDIHERPWHPFGAELRDAWTGKTIWGKPDGDDMPGPDTGRGVAMDIDPRFRGYEMWASGPGLNGVWNVSGKQISQRKPRSCNFGIWWDGDTLREILDANHVDKWDWTTETEKRLLTAEGCSSNNGTKSTPALCADFLGDWREELMERTLDGKELRIFTTTIPTEHRFYTLMQDPQYRLAIVWQNVAYNQPPHPGFYLGDGMNAPPKPNIVMLKQASAK